MLTRKLRSFGPVTVWLCDKHSGLHGPMSCSCSSREQVFRLLPLVDQIVAPVKGCSWQRGRSSPTCSDDPFAITHWINQDHSSTRTDQSLRAVPRLARRVSKCAVFVTEAKHTEQAESVEAYDTVYD